MALCLVLCMGWSAAEEEETVITAFLEVADASWDYSQNYTLNMIAERTGVRLDTTGYVFDSSEAPTQKQLTLKAPRVIGKYGSGNEFFKIPESVFSEGFYTVYNCLYLEPKQGSRILAAFTSSHTYAGQFRFKENYIEAIEDMEDRWILPGETWVLDEFGVFCGEDRDSLYSVVSKAVRSDYRRGWRR